MTAAEYVALARRVAEEHLATGLVYASGRLIATNDGQGRVIPSAVFVPTAAVMQTILTPEDTASEDALVRALLASAVTVIAHDEASEAILCGVTASGVNDSAARDRLIDALLSRGDGMSTVPEAFAVLPAYNDATDATAAATRSGCADCGRALVTRIDDDCRDRRHGEPLPFHPEDVPRQYPPALDHGDA